MIQLRELYKRTVRSITVPILERCLRWLDAKSWMPVFFFFLGRTNTGAIQMLHVLDNIQVKTGRRVILITSWPFWPWATAKDPNFVSFIRGLTPNFRYVWIPYSLQRWTTKATMSLLRYLQIQDILLRPMGLRSTIRFTTTSTIDQTDILNEGSRVRFHIPKSHEHVMEERLKDLGVSPDDWFVCAHAREHGFLRDMKAYDQELPAGYRHEMDDYRNVDIEDFYPAFEHITAMGGKVVRLGDESMKRVNGIDGLIDYPFTELKSMPMDLYLVSRCRFLLGCTSGVAACFAQSFGTPVLVTNLPFALTSVGWPYSNNVVMPKQVEETASGRRLTAREMFDPLIWNMQNRRNWPSFHTATSSDEPPYRWLPNTPDDILQATKEMLELAETDSFNRPRTAEQELFHRLRLEALDARSSTADQTYNANWSMYHSAESRISASYSARYFRE